MFRTRTHEKFLEEFHERRDDANEYQFETEYIASNATIVVRHLLCDTIFETTPVKLTRTRSPIRCTTCVPSFTQKKSLNEVEEEVERYGNNEFSLINDDVSDGLHWLTIVHNKCGYEFKVYRNNMLTWGLSCPNCNQAANKRNKTMKKHEEMATRVKVLSENKYELISEYKGYSKPVKIREVATGLEEEITYNGLIQRIQHEFPHQTRNLRKEQELKQMQVKKRVKDDSFGRYILKSEYKGYDEKVDVYDNRTGKVDTITYASLHARIKKMNTQHQVYRDEYEENRLG